MNDKQEAKFQELTGQPVGHLVCKMAAPTIISMMVTACYNMVDTYFVGQLHSNSATGAVGVVFSLMAVIQAVGFFFGHGSGNYISRQLGRHESGDAGKMAATGVTLAFLAGCVILALGQIFLTPLARLLGSTDTILPYARSYLRIILLGAPYMTASFVLNNQLRFQGSAAYGMVGIAAGAVLNVGLDPLLIFVLDMGVAGAALATILSQLASFCMLLLGCSRGGNLRIRLRNVCIRRDLLVDHQIQFTSEVRWAEDLVFNMQYLEYANVLVSIPEAGYYYVQNPQSICHTQINPATIVQNKIQVFRYYKDLYTRLGMYEQVRPQLYKFLVDIAESTYPSGPFKEVIDEAKAYWKDAREDVQTRTAEARERWNGMREELRETAQERSAEWKARHDSDPKE